MPHTADSPPAGAPESAWAQRASRSRWRDPRLVLGVVLVLACALLGARMLARVDDYADVWSVRRDLPAGSPLLTEDLQVRQVRFRDQADADRYLAADETPGGVVLSHPLGAGELVPRNVLTVQSDPVGVHLPLGVPPARIPTDLAAGDVVDVWVVPTSDILGSLPGEQGKAAISTTPSAELALAQVVVLSAGVEASAFGAGGIQTVVVEVDERQAADLPFVLPALTTGEVVLVQRGG